MGSTPARQRCGPPDGSACCMSVGNAWREAYTAGGEAALSSLEIINVGAFSVQRLGPHRKRRHGRGAMGRPGSAHERTPARAGKMAKRTACRVVSRHGLRFARTSSKYGKALSAKWLAIRAGRPGVRRRTAGGAGAPPRKRPWLAQAGLSERSLLGVFLAGRRGRPGQPQRRSPKASGPLLPLSRLAIRVKGPDCVVSYLGFAECSSNRHK